MIFTRPIYLFESGLNSTKAISELLKSTEVSTGFLHWMQFRIGRTLFGLVLSFALK
jgi:hypothetical protein